MTPLPFCVMVVAMAQKQFRECPHCKGCGRVEVTAEYLVEQKLKTARFSNIEMERFVASFGGGGLEDLTYDHFKKSHAKYWARITLDARINILFEDYPREEVFAKLAKLYPESFLVWCERNNR